MDYRTLGRIGWEVSEIACGTFKSFDVPGEQGVRQVEALMQANLEVGVNLFDSAPMYGNSEANIGEALPALGMSATKGECFIATKVLQEDIYGARRQIDHSFSVIGGRIDLLQIHNMAGWKAILPHLGDLREQGKIGAVGVTHYDSTAFGEIEAAMKTGIPDMIQVPYNLLQREVENRLLPLADDLNLGVLLMSPIQPMGRRATILETLGRNDLSRFSEFGVNDPGGLCLKYLLSKNPRVIPIPATSNLARIRSNSAVSGTPPLPPELIAEVEKMVA